MSGARTCACTCDGAPTVDARDAGRRRRSSRLAGHPYLEPHHTRRLSDGGPDDYHHVIALYPTCHRRVHHADDGESYNAELRIRLESLEP